MDESYLADRGQNLFQTSTHTAHHWRPGYYFPSSNFKPVLLEPIPKTLNMKDEILPKTHFETTNDKFHDNKFPNHDLYNEPLSMRQVKALPSYKVNYMADVVEKLNSKPRRPLTMAFQKSEYKGEYEDQDNELNYLYDRPIHPKSYLDQDEKNNQMTRIAYDGNVKPNAPFNQPNVDPSQIGVFNLLDPYLTTYNKGHIKWNAPEIKNLTKNDAITIYNSSNVVPNKVPDSKAPMRDAIWFKSDAKIRQVHSAPKPVPNTGLISETREMYVTPSDVKAKEAKLCPITNPFTLPENSTKTVYANNRMYQTEYTNIGKGKLDYHY